MSRADENMKLGADCDNHRQHAETHRETCKKAAKGGIYLVKRCKLNHEIVGRNKGKTALNRIRIARFTVALPL